MKRLFIVMLKVWAQTTGASPSLSKYSYIAQFPFKMNFEQFYVVNLKMVIYLLFSSLHKWWWWQWDDVNLNHTSQTILLYMFMYRFNYVNSIDCQNNKLFEIYLLHCTVLLHRAHSVLSVAQVILLSSSLVCCVQKCSSARMWLRKSWLFSISLSCCHASFSQCSLLSQFVLLIFRIILIHVALTTTSTTKLTEKK